MFLDFGFHLRPGNHLEFINSNLQVFRIQLGFGFFREQFFDHLVFLSLFPCGTEICLLLEAFRIGECDDVSVDEAGFYLSYLRNSPHFNSIHPSPFKIHSSALQIQILNFWWVQSNFTTLLDDQLKKIVNLEAHCSYFGSIYFDVNLLILNSFYDLL